MDEVKTGIADFQFYDFEVIDPSRRAAQLGLVTLETDLTIEDELRFFLSGPAFGVNQGSVSLLHSRIPCDDQVTAENLQNMAGHFASSLALFPPNHDFDVIGYGCTSASLLIGADRVEALIREHIDVPHVTTPITAAKRALQALGAKRIGYLAPYISEISKKMCLDFEADGFPVEVAATFGEGKDSVVGRIDPTSITAALTALYDSADGNIDAIFVSCTSLKCASIIAAAEEKLGIPVISSNSALAWDMARLANIDVSQAKSSDSGQTISPRKGLLFDQD